jgi:hypothetical protein
MTSDDRARLELEHLHKQVEKLSLEVDRLRETTFWDRTIGRYLPLITAALAVGGFWFGVFQYMGQRNETERLRVEAERERTAEITEAAGRRAEELRRETARPFWEAQLRLYLRAAEAAATVATARDRKDAVKAESDFWILYWGPLAAVEDVGLEKKTAAIEAAMVKFGAALNQGESNPDRRELERLSLALAHAIRDAVGPAFELQAAPATQERFKRP